MSQDKPAINAADDDTPDAAVELNEATLDSASAVGAGNETLVGIDFRPNTSGFYGTGVYETTDGGR